MLDKEAKYQEIIRSGHFHFTRVLEHSTLFQRNTYCCAEDYCQHIGGSPSNPLSVETDYWCHHCFLYAHKECVRGASEHDRNVDVEFFEGYCLYCLSRTHGVTVPEEVDGYLDLNSRRIMQKKVNDERKYGIVPTELLSADKYKEKAKELVDRVFGQDNNVHPATKDRSIQHDDVESLDCEGMTPKNK